MVPDDSKGPSWLQFPKFTSRALKILLENGTYWQRLLRKLLIQSSLKKIVGCVSTDGTETILSCCYVMLTVDAEKVFIVFWKHNASEKLNSYLGF